jgi:hypothetical protein
MAGLVGLGPLGPGGLPQANPAMQSEVKATLSTGGSVAGRERFVPVTEPASDGLAARNFCPVR